MERDEHFPFRVVRFASGDGATESKDFPDCGGTGPPDTAPDHRHRVQGSIRFRINVLASRCFDIHVDDRESSARVRDRCGRDRDKIRETDSDMSGADMADRTRDLKPIETGDLVQGQERIQCLRDEMIHTTFFRGDGTESSPPDLDPFLRRFSEECVREFDTEEGTFMFFIDAVSESIDDLVRTDRGLDFAAGELTGFTDIVGSGTPGAGTSRGTTRMWSPDQMIIQLGHQGIERIRRFRVDRHV